MTDSLIGKRILLVDDDLDVLHFVRRALEKSGAEVVVASSTETALRNIAMTKPAIVVADISMPGCDGYELVRRMRDQETEHTPAIALTANVREADIMKAAEAGFDAHVAKPTRAFKLIRAIQDVISAPRDPSGRIPSYR